MKDLILRPRQSNGISMAHKAINSGHRRILLVGPTGFGKRLLAVWWAMKAHERQRSIGIITYRRIVLWQMIDELESFGVPLGVIAGEVKRDEFANVAFVQAASFKTLTKRYLPDPSTLPAFDIIIVDEAHEMPAAYEDLLKHYPNAIVILLTATPIGPGGKRLPCDVMIEPAKNSELIREGWLLPTVTYAPSEPSIQGVKLDRGRDSQERLGGVIQGVTAFADLWNEWAPFADRKTIVFAPGIAYCNGLAMGSDDSFRSRGIEAAVIDYKTKRCERKELFERFEHGDLKVLVCVNVLAVGFDAPIASCGIDLQPNTQFRTYWQKIGRVKRLFPGQQEAVWIDMAGNWHKFYDANDDPDWDKVCGENTVQEVLAREYKRGEKPKPIVCPKCHRQRPGGSACPECGEHCTKQIRRIRMGNGRLRQVSLEEKKKTEKSDHDKVVAKWKSEIYAAHRGNKTMMQARISFHRRNGFWPPNNLPGMPAFGSADWGRKAAKVIPPDSLHEVFSRIST